MFRLNYKTSYYFTHPWEVVSEIYWDIKAGIRSILRWVPVLWFDRDYDWTYIVRIMERKFELMAIEHRDHSYHLNADVSEKQLRICQELCKRLRQNEYDEIIGDPDAWSPPIGPWHQRYRDHGFKSPERQYYEEYMKQQDINLLTKLMSKHLQKWWS